MNSSRKEDDVAEVISNVVKELNGIRDSLPMSDNSFVEIKNKINDLSVTSKKHQLKVKELSDALDRIIKLYEKTENNIVTGAVKYQQIIKEISQSVQDVLDIIGRIAAGLFDGTSCYDGDPVNMCTGNYVDSVTEIDMVGMLWV